MVPRLVQLLGSAEITCVVSVGMLVYVYACGEACAVAGKHQVNVQVCLHVCERYSVILRLLCMFHFHYRRPSYIFLVGLIMCG